MPSLAVVGINWGDEGKGRMVDLIARDYDFVVRYQGGNNAGHTVVNETYGKQILNLLPSGVFNPNTVNVLGNGMVIDLAHLCQEIERLKNQGVPLDPDHLKISDRAMICFPFHVAQDTLQEAYLGDQKFGSTKRGIGPAYSDKYAKKGVQMGDLLLGEDHLRKLIVPLTTWKNLTLVNVYGGEALDPEAMVSWAVEHGERLKPYICDTGLLLAEALKKGRRVMYEAQLGALRDIEFGIYPYTSSSSPLAAYAPLGAGVPGHAPDEVLGIIKAYSSCVGEGPFAVELFGDAGNALREAGQEYGAATGRPRRVGGFDVVASRYGVRMQGATSLALTKLDVLSDLKTIPVCTHYEVAGCRTQDFPFPGLLANAKAVYQDLPGWGCEIGHIRTYDALPQAARDYIEWIEEQVGCPIQYISVGADREAYIKRF